jgi:8-oxo-dGTP pyrophosphatase MutT (NUDIX family)
MDSEKEIERLAALFGEPVRLSAMLPSDHSYLADLDDRRTKEVLMVVRRPTGRLLTMTKPFYPGGVFRLPTGGVDAGESILEALNREVVEETSLQVEVTRFLAYIEYRITEREHPEGLPIFETFAFLMSETGGQLRTSDPNEPMEFKEVELADIPLLAKALEELEDTQSHEIGDTWASWGSFRAIAQMAVHRALRGDAAKPA